MKRGLLIIVSGPSGVGKGTICKKLRRERLLDAVYPISYTTRNRRLKEADGKEYNFIDKSLFKKMIDADMFLEYSKYCDNLYGTPKEAIIPPLKKGENVLLEIETKGAEKIMEQFRGMYTLSIFILPPDFEELKRRLTLRHMESGAVERRLEIAREEIAKKDLYDVCLTNYALSKTTKRLLQAVENRVRYIEAVESGKDIPEGYIIKRP